MVRSTVGGRPVSRVEAAASARRPPLRRPTLPAADGHVPRCGASDGAAEAGPGGKPVPVGLDQDQTVQLRPEARVEHSLDGQPGRGSPGRPPGPPPAQSIRSAIWKAHSCCRANDGGVLGGEVDQHPGQRGAAGCGSPPSPRSRSPRRRRAASRGSRAGSPARAAAPSLSDAPCRHSPPKAPASRGCRQLVGGVTVPQRWRSIPR